MRNSFDRLNKRVQIGLTRKAKEHNQKYPNMKTSKYRLAVVFWRGKGAYKSNPQSVRKNINSPEQWAYARVNSFLSALRNGRFRSGKHDIDMLPKNHRMSS